MAFYILCSYLGSVLEGRTFLKEKAAEAGVVATGSGLMYAVCWHTHVVCLVGARYSEMRTRMLALKFHTEYG